MFFLFISTELWAQNQCLPPVEEIPLRKPANFVHDDEVEVVPFGQSIWLEKILVEDDGGTLQGMKNQFNDWQSKETYVQQWDLETTNLYKTPDAAQKRGYMGTNLLRYFDKRLAGEIKNSEDGSYMHAVSEVHQALRPKAEAQLSQNVKIKFKARALQGKAYLIVDNPYVEAQSMVTAQGRVEMSLAKNLKPIGVQTRVNYYVRQNQYIAEVDKRITDNIIARYSSSQDDKTMLFNEQSNQTIQLIYSHPF